MSAPTLFPDLDEHAAEIARENAEIEAEIAEDELRAEYEEDDEPVPARKRTSKSTSTPREPKREQPEHACATCGMTWGEGCDCPAWFWTDYGFIGMNGCTRCGREVCCFCRARYEHGVLCPACFAIDTPPTIDDARRHLLVTRNHFEPERVLEYFGAIAWRFEEPAGQYTAINPVLLWYWQNRDFDDRGREPATKDEKRARDHQWDVVNCWKTPTLLDATWLPQWAADYVNAHADGAAAQQFQDAEDEPGE
jgi:hypothetical protein